VLITKRTLPLRPLATVHTLVGVVERSSVTAGMLAGEHTNAPTADALALIRRPVCESSRLQAPVVR